MKPIQQDAESGNKNNKKLWQTKAHQNTLYICASLITVFISYTELQQLTFLVCSVMCLLLS